MYHNTRCGWETSPIQQKIEVPDMKKWIVICLLLFLTSGCSAKKIWNWMDKMDWERDDQTVHTFHLFIR
ncbi:MAG: hypothetical protein QG577_2715 [Thermodesulfobacteriota bacterium]|nr:hypothetical protein [Thermodesulfobacteriota bacterium]